LILIEKAYEKFLLVIIGKP